MGPCLHCDTLLGVEHKHLLKEIHCKRVGVRVELREWHPLHVPPNKDHAVSLPTQTLAYRSGTEWRERDGDRMVMVVRQSTHSYFTYARHVLPTGQVVLYWGTPPTQMIKAPIDEILPRLASFDMQRHKDSHRITTNKRVFVLKFATSSGSMGAHFWCWHVR